MKVSLADAMWLIMQEGSPESDLKKARMKAKIYKEAKQPGWEQAMLKEMDTEWKWRVGCAKLALGDLSWDYWGYRNPRDFIIPDLAPWWDGTPVDNLLILGEQGLGDEILFMSCLNEVPAKHITVECDKRLVPVFSQNFPDVEFIGRKHYIEGKWETDDSWAEGRHWDAQILLGELPTWYRLKPEDFPPDPYLYVDVDARYVGRVGVSWKGRQGGFDPSLFPQHAVSLQYGVDDHPFEKADIDLKNDIDGLFSIIAGLERLVSVPTTVVHIAGALGIPVDLILPPIGTNHGGFDESVNNALNWRLNRYEKIYRWHPSVNIYTSWKDYERTQRLSLA